MASRERRLKDVELVDDEPPDEPGPVGARRLRRGAVLIVAVGIAVVAVAAIGLARGSNDQGTPISLLDRARRTADALPDSGADDLIASSSRQVAQAGDATFWVARDETGLYCFVTAISGAEGGAGSTCGNRTTLERGIVLSLNVGAASVTAALVADGAAAPSAPGSWTRISDNVFLDSP
ncbi:hypothetical protein [Pengzhenrongella sicca]|uniref:Uncharacterized protein n=1 Tax=Pengzhenrongella sicca TaxID=2819238 RepID=A0A8A4ZKS4_9MICO|nr:hypothetical protein [Pengzhenrongella sicca]QTE31106.1 hypothetical protein J4E96_09380 [Pengzhenrongella sicca]